MENETKLWNAQITLIPKNQDGPKRVVVIDGYKSVIKPTKVNPFWRNEVKRRWAKDGSDFVSDVDRQKMGGIALADVSSVFDPNEKRNCFGNKVVKK